jgi:hypothetical protein
MYSLHNEDIRGEYHTGNYSDDIPTVEMDRHDKQVLWNTLGTQENTRNQHRSKLFQSLSDYREEVLFLTQVNPLWHE